MDQLRELIVAMAVLIICLSILVWWTGVIVGKKTSPFSFAIWLVRRSARLVGKAFRAVSQLFYGWGHQLGHALRDQSWYWKTVAAMLILTLGILGFLFSIPAELFRAGGKGGDRK